LILQNAVVFLQYAHVIPEGNVVYMLFGRTLLNGTLA